jgi:citrate lyase subunit beta/citryl-CoA lyase
MPKIDMPTQVVQLDSALRQLEAKYGRAPGSVAVIALVESPLAICNVVAIAQSSRRLTGLGFGVEDFCAAMGTEPQPESMTLPAQTVAIAAAAAGLMPLGLPGSVADFSDLEKYRALAVLARTIGMRGTMCIHPAQVPVLNDVFGGTKLEADAARRMLAVFDAAVAAGHGAVSHEGRMVDEPIAVRARRFLQRHDALQGRQMNEGEPLQ